MEGFPETISGQPQYEDTVLRVQELQRLMEQAQNDPEGAKTSESLLQEIDQDKQELAKMVNIVLGGIGAVGGLATGLAASEGNYDSAIFAGAYSAGLMTVIKAASMVPGAIDRFQQWNQGRKQSNLHED